MAAQVLPLDLSVPSYRAAYQLARPLAVAGDRAGATKLLCRLLWHVSREDGGFIGLTDSELEAKCAADPRLDYAVANEMMWARGSWPVAAGNQVAA